MNINREVAKMCITKMVHSRFEFRLMEYSNSYIDRRSDEELIIGWIIPYLKLMRGEGVWWK